MYHYIFYVGYLSTRFEYFLNRFAQTLDQVRPKLDQDRARRALSDALFTFSKRPTFAGENLEIIAKKVKKTFKKKKNLVRFAYEQSIVRPTTDSDRTRRALSISHLTHQFRVYRY